MRTVELLKILDNKNRKVFHAGIKKHHRKKLLLLLDWFLKNGEATTNKKEMYEAVFNAQYEEDKDYLLRNELRLLNNELEDFIASLPLNTDTSKDNLQKEINLLQHIAETGNEALFNTYFNTALKQASQAGKFETLAKLYSLKSKFLIRFKEISIKTYNEIIHLLQLENQALTSLSEETLSINTLYLHYSQRVLEQLQGTSKSLPSLKALPLLAEAALIIQYNKLIAASYLQKGEEKIETLLAALKIHPKIIVLREEKKRDTATIYGNIALEYFLHEQHEKAHHYYKKAIASCIPAQINIELLFNYCINALAMGHHKYFIDIAKQHQTAIAGNHKLKYRFQYFTAMALLFENKPKEAFLLLDHDISKRPENEYYFYRMVYSMVYYQLNDFDLAARELENILQSFRFRKPIEAYDKALVKAMQQLLATHALRHQKEKYAKELHKLKKQTHELRQDTTRFSKTIHKWLRLQISKMEK